MSDDKKKTDDFEEEINFDELDDVEVFSDSSDEKESDDLDSELEGLSDKAEEFDLDEDVELEGDVEPASDDLSLDDDSSSETVDEEDLELGDEEPELEASEEEESSDLVDESIGESIEEVEEDLSIEDDASDEPKTDSDDFEFGDDDSLNDEFSLEDGDDFGFGEDDDVNLEEDKPESKDSSPDEELSLDDDLDFADDESGESELENDDFDFSDSDLEEDTSDLDGLVDDDIDSISDDDLEVVDLGSPVDLNELEDSIESDKNDKSKSDEALSLTDEEKKDMKEMDIDEKKSGAGKTLVLSAAILGALGVGAYMFAGDEIKSALGLSEDYADEQPVMSVEERKKLKEERLAKLKAKRGSSDSSVKQGGSDNPVNAKQSVVGDSGELALDLGVNDSNSSQMVVPDDSEFSLDLDSPEVEVLSEIQDVDTAIEIDDSSTYEIAGYNSSVAGSGEYVSKEKYDELAAKLEEMESLHDKSYKALMGLTREFQLSERELNAKIIASDRDRKSDLEKVLKVAAIALTKANTNTSGIEQVSVDFDRKLNNFDGKLAEAASDSLSNDEVEKLKAVIAEQQEKINKMTKDSEERMKVFEKRLTEISKSSSNEKHSSEVPVEKLLNGSDSPINIKIQRASEGSDGATAKKKVLPPYKLMGFLPNKVYLFRDGNSYEIEVGSYLPEYGEITRLNYSTKEVFYGDNKRVNIVY